MTRSDAAVEDDAGLPAGLAHPSNTKTLSRPGLTGLRAWPGE